MTRAERVVVASDVEGRGVRMWVRAWCADAGVGDATCEDVLLVTSELFSNAVSATANGGRITIALDRNAAGVLVRVENVGPGFTLDEVPPPSNDRRGGRGIAIARALGAVRVEQHGERTVVSVQLSIVEPLHAAAT